MTVRTALALLSLVALTACPTEDTDTTDTDTDSTPPDVELTGNVGSIHFLHWPADAKYPASGEAAALFSDTDGGVVNLAGCVLGSGGACYTALPTEDAWATPDANTDFLDTFELFKVGGSFVAAGVRFEVSYTDDGDPLYFGEADALGTGTGDIEIDGDFAHFAGTGAFPLVDAMVTIAPAVSEIIKVGAGETVDFAWESAATGDVVLGYAGEHIKLADNAPYTLDLDRVAWETPLEQRIIRLSRETTSTFDASGNELTVQTISEQWFYVEYTDTSVLTEITLHNTCAEASASDSTTPPGNYHGDMSTGFTGGITLEADNDATGYSTAGFDGIAVIQLEAGQTLTVNYRQVTQDASLYLMSDCSDLTTIALGADDVPSGQAETLEYTATATGPVFLIADVYTEGDPEGGRFQLEFSVSTPQ